MRLPVIALAVVAGGSLLLSGCATRAVEYTLVKSDVSQSQRIQDEKVLRDTSGVQKIITRADSSNGVLLELYLDEDNTTKGLQAATDLGYQQVRN